MIFRADGTLVCELAGLSELAAKGGVVEDADLPFTDLKKFVAFRLGKLFNLFSAFLKILVFNRLWIILLFLHICTSSSKSFFHIFGLLRSFRLLGGCDMWRRFPLRTSSSATTTLPPVASTVLSDFRP